MPHKINFTVISSSCDDDKHPASNLNPTKHEPLVQGWISPKFCLFPVEIMIKLENRALINKVQILSHQYLIPSKIEFYIGDCTPGVSDLEEARFTRLGFVEMSTNDRTDFKARELKSVHVDAEGCFLKFILHKNHINKFNTYNQIGIVAINVIGTDNKDLIENMQIREINPSVVAAVNRPDYISPLDDLAFALYQDPEISQIIRNLDKKKTEYVLAEKYDEAKRLKQALSELYKIGERLARYDIEKRQAIQDEDYEKAKLKKQQMAEYRSETYKQLQKHNLLSFLDGTNEYRSTPQQNGELSPNLSFLPPVVKEIKTPREKRQEKTSRSSSPTIHTTKQITNLPPIHDNRAITNNDTSPPPTFLTQSNIDQDRDRPVTPYEDRIIPTLRKNKEKDGDTSFALPTKSRNAVLAIEENPAPSALGNPNNNLSNISINNPNNTSVVEEADTEQTNEITGEMTERDLREAAQMNDSLGKPIVTKLYSKNFQVREEAIQEAFQKLSNFKGDKEDAKTLMRAAVLFVTRTIKDNVFTIFNSGLKFLQFILNDFYKTHSIGKMELIHTVERCVPILLHRTGDTNTRLRQRTHEFLVEMSAYDDVKPLHIIPAQCTVPLKPQTAPRLALSRVEIVSDLIKCLGTRENGLTIENVSRFCSEALEHTSGDVREVAIKIIIQMYKEYGNVIRKYLPQDNEMNRRNKKYRTIYEAFDKIDGKPIHLDDKTTQEMLEKAKKLETDALKKEIKAIKDQRLGKTQPTAPTPAIVGSGGGGGDNPSSPKPNRNKSPASVADESDFNPDNTCIFCGETSEKFVKEGLELHYFKVCPMLRRCAECKQVVEIAAQTDHLLNECEASSNYKKCPRCLEAVNAQDHDHHFKQKLCSQTTDGMAKCPLCHHNISSHEDSWKDHLMKPNGCTKNPRKHSNTNSNHTEKEEQKIKTKKK